MQSRTRVSRQRRENRIAHRLFVSSVVGTLGVFVVGCHDAASGPVAPAPQPAVSTDGAWLVNSLADPGDGVCTNSQCTLREAIAAAQSGDRITFKSNLSGTISMVAGTFLIGKHLTIAGPGANELAVNGRGDGPVFEIGVYGPPPQFVTISGLTIEGGNAANASGGGISVQPDGRLTLIGSVVAGNRAHNGGGIYNIGEATLVGSTIANNDATSVGGGVYSAGQLTVSRSTISGNDAGLNGGGHFYHCIIAFCPTGLTLRSSTITRNDAANGEGLSVSSVGSIWNTIVAGNATHAFVSAPDADCEDPFAMLTSLGYNLSSAGNGCPFTATGDILIASALQVFTAVLEPVLADNGSARKTHGLIERGFAVDAGYCPGENGDQRGFPRPYDDPVMANALDACDIGAFEWQPTDSRIKGPKP